MTGMGQMHPDLMGPPGFQPAFHQRQRRGAAKPLDNPGPGHGMAAALKQHRLTLAVGLVAGQLRGDLQDIRGLEADPLCATQPRVAGIGHAIDQRQIAAVNGMTLELVGQPMVGRVMLGHHQQPGGVLVDPVDDPGPLFAADPRQAVAAMMQQRIDQRAAPRPRGRMHHHARSLVEDDQIGIFIDHVQRDILGLCHPVDRIFQPHPPDLPGQNPRLDIGDGNPVQRDSPLGDQPRQARA